MSNVSLVPYTKSLYHETLFVYGTLKSEGINNEIIKKAQGRLVGEGFTEEEKYEMVYLKQENGFPILFDCGNGSKVMGEVWRLPKYRLREIDDFEGHTYERRRIPIAFYFNSQRSAFKKVLWRTEAFCYFGKENHWLDFVGQADNVVPCPLYTRVTEPKWTYYSFTKFLTQGLKKNV